KNEIGASIPGTITKILVKNGDQVKAGQSLVVIEAMKMESQIVAPLSGKITSIAVQEEQQVKNGELLMKIEQD
ncbi:MAG TPA: biotin/lipoyl-containing protein, partial [Syntrophomonadaceae bacterium]|nr:biotin/lipoyl-containing protein [Syntrophomonadaceae bacterium]